MSDITRIRPNAEQADTANGHLDEIAKAINRVANSITTSQDETYLAMLNEENYTTVMKKWFMANGCAAMADLSALCDKWYTITRQGWFGGVRFDIPAEGAAAPSDGTKTGDNAGLICIPSTTQVANQDDYAGIPLFAVVDCNAYLDDTGKPHILAIRNVAGPFEKDNPEKIVAVLQMTGWERFVIENDTYGWDYTDDIGRAGFNPLPEARELADNSDRTWVVHAKYTFGEGWTCCSGQKTKVYNVSHNSQITGVRTAWGERYCGVTSADDAFLKLMNYLKYGRLDSDRHLVGCLNYNLDYTPAVAETGVERIIVTVAQGNNLIVGSCVNYGPSARAASNPVDRCKITAIEIVEIDGEQYAAVYVDNGGVTFDTATDGHLATMPWWTGATDDVLGNDGGISPTAGKYPVKIQGIEIMLGCWETAGDTQLVYEDRDGVNACTPYICRDATKIAATRNSSYRQAPVFMPTPTAAAYCYAKQMRSSNSMPEVIIGVEMGGSTSTGCRDGFSLLIVTAGAFGWLRFGSLYTGVGDGGLSCGLGGTGLSSAAWRIGGRLSLTGNRGEFLKPRKRRQKRGDARPLIP